MQLRPWFQLRNIAKEVEVGTKNRKVLKEIEKNSTWQCGGINSLERNEVEQSMGSKGVNDWLY